MIDREPFGTVDRVRRYVREMQFPPRPTMDDLAAARDNLRALVLPVGAELSTELVLEPGGVRVRIGPARAGARPDICELVAFAREIPTTAEASEW